MPVFTRVAGEWQESIPFARSGSQWSGESDSLYSRVAGEWVLVHPDPAAVGELLPVEGLAVTSGPTDRAVTVGWTNPTQPTITPTDVQVRVAELGAVWTEYAYPITSAAWASLDADTEYVVQVRLIRRVDGIVTDTSPIRHVQFTTDPAPIGAPAPDPGGSAGDTTFPWTGSTGNPTAPGTNDGCWWEIVVQILNDNAASWSDTTITDTVAGDADSWEVDLSSLDPGRIYRTCRREACDTDTDGVADTWGDWECSLPFPAPTDWDAACGGFADSTNVSGLTATADAVFRYPYLCKNSDSNQMVMLEEVSGVELARGPGFYSFFTDSDGEKGVKAAPGETGAPWLIVGALTAVASMLVAEADWTILSRFRATSDFTASNGRVSTIGVFGGVVTVSLTESATGWTPTVAVLTSDGIKILTGAEITYDEAVTHTIATRWDDDGDLELLVEGVSADTEDVSSIDVYESPSLAAYNGAPAGLAIMQQIGWDRALTDEELVELDAVGPRPTYVGNSGWVESSGLTDMTISGIQVGDLIITSVWPWNESPHPPDGWTALPSDLDTQTFPRHHSYKFADADDVANGWGETGVRRGISFAFRDVDVDDPIESIAAQGEANPIADADLSGTFPSMTASLRNSLAVYLLVQGDDGQTDSFAGGATELFSASVNATSQQATLAVAAKESDAGAVSGATWLASFNGLKESLQFVLKPEH